MKQISSWSTNHNYLFGDVACIALNLKSWPNFFKFQSISILSLPSIATDNTFKSVCIKCHTSRPLNSLLDCICVVDFFIDVLPKSFLKLIVVLVSFITTGNFLLFCFLELVVGLAL